MILSQLDPVDQCAPFRDLVKMRRTFKSMATWLRGPDNVDGVKSIIAYSAVIDRERYTNELVY